MKLSKIVLVVGLAASTSVAQAYWGVDPIGVIVAGEMVGVTAGEMVWVIS